MVQFTSTIFYDPTLIILDEPFTGLDPINTNKMKNLIIDLQKNGKTIIFSTHRMEQVEEICDKIVLIHKGRIILEGQISEIKQQFKKNKYKIEFADNIAYTVQSDKFEVVEQNQNKLIIKNVNIDTSTNQLISNLLTIGELISFSELLPSLNEIFIEQVSNYSKEHNIVFEEDPQNE
jgi:ABC-2 type transport system ATP-binding protein